MSDDSGRIVIGLIVTIGGCLLAGICLWWQSKKSLEHERKYGEQARFEGAAIQVHAKDGKAMAQQIEVVKAKAKAKVLMAKASATRPGVVADLALSGDHDDVRGDTWDRKNMEVQQPLWWESWPQPGQSRRVSARPEMNYAVQALMNHTWRSIKTRDRHGRIQYFEVLQVLHNENRSSWENYVRTRESIRTKAHTTTGAVPPASAKTTAIAREIGLEELCNDLDSWVNEFLLFHGTTPAAANNICDNDFRLDLAGRNAGQLYGPGLYFAESSSKSDEYASDDAGGGCYAMLLCRVTCGRIFETADVKPDVDHILKECTSIGARYDSVLGDREQARGTYREFVLFNKEQVYPEFVIVYKRTDEYVDETCLLEPVVAPSQIHWECAGDAGVVIPYSSENSRLLEDAYHSGQASISLIVGPKGWKYTIDLTRMVQISDTTKAERAIRRIDPNESDDDVDTVEPESARSSKETGEKPMAAAGTGSSEHTPFLDQCMTASQSASPRSAAPSPRISGAHTKNPKARAGPLPVPEGSVLIDTAAKMTSPKAKKASPKGKSKAKSRTQAKKSHSGRTHGAQASTQVSAHKIGAENGELKGDFA